ARPGRPGGRPCPGHPGRLPRGHLAVAGRPVGPRHRRAAEAGEGGAAPGRRRGPPPGRRRPLPQPAHPQPAPPAPPRRRPRAALPRLGGADRRGWEWHYLDGLYSSELLGLNLRPGPRGSVALIGRRQIVALAEGTGELRFWDAADGVPLPSLTVPRSVHRL